jgi:hypothetical protein
MSEPGPLERAVRDSMAARPANEIAKQSVRVRGCFAGLFNGALSEGSVNAENGLFIGKAECEWGWPEDWDTLRDAGLIEYRLVDGPKVKMGKPWKRLLWSITEKGMNVRTDDVRAFRELMAARDDDEKPAKRS